MWQLIKELHVNTLNSTYMSEEFKIYLFCVNYYQYIQPSCKLSFVMDGRKNGAKSWNPSFSQMTQVEPTIVPSIGT